MRRLQFCFLLIIGTSPISLGPIRSCAILVLSCVESNEGNVSKKMASECDNCDTKAGHEQRDTSQDSPIDGKKTTPAFGCYLDHNTKLVYAYSKLIKKRSG
jgi:hypothetical protein